MAGLAVILIVFAKPPADFAGLDPDEGILTWLEPGPFSKNFGGEDELIDLRGPVLEVVVTDQFQKALQLRRPPPLSRAAPARN